MTTRTKLYICIGAAAVLLVFVVGAAVGAFAAALIGVTTEHLVASAAPVSAPRPAADAEAEYHRGLYDICRSAMQASQEQCLKAVITAHEHHWYEQASPGWSWPLPAQSLTATQ